MRKIFFIITVLFNVLPSVAQEIVIRDLISYNPLELVTLHSENPPVSITTDAKGIADITDFKGADSIYVRLIGYKTRILSYEEIEEKDFKLFLEESSFSLDEVVISVSRWKQKRGNLPNRITSIKSSGITFQNPQTAADMLTTTGEVYVQKSQLGGGSPMIRGFATNRVLLVVDGVRMNTAIFRSGNVQNVISIDPFTVEQTEVVFGAGSVIYGSDAIGGVMNFYTRKPKLSRNNKLLFTGNAVARYSSANNEKTGHLQFNSGTKQWGFLSSISYSGFDDLKMGSHGPEEYLRHEYAARINGRDTILPNPDPRLQKPSGYNQINIMQKIRFKPSGTLDMQYGFLYSATSDYPRYDRLIRYRDDKLRSAEWYYGPQIWMMNNLRLTHSQTNRLYDKLSAILAWQYFKESRHDRDFGSTEKTHRIESVNAYTANIDLEKEFNDRHRLFYGIELLSNLVGSQGEDEIITTGTMIPGSTRYPDGSTWNSYAAYMNHRFIANKKLTLQSGLRYNIVSLSANFDTTFFPFPFTSAGINTSALNGSVGIVFKPLPELQVNLSLSTGFRAPNIDDIGKVFDSEPGSVVVPNPDLDPEYSYNMEFGFIHFINDLITFDLTGYYTILNNAMVRRNYMINGMDSIIYDGEMSRVQAIQNTAQAYVWGIQAGAKINLPAGFSISSKYSYQNGEEETEDGNRVPLRHAAPPFGSTHLTYKRERFKTDLYTVYNGKITYENLSPEERGKTYMYAVDKNGDPWSPGWYTLNIKAMYHFTNNISINAGIENITDQRYRPYSSGIAAPGINFIVSFKVSI